MAPDRCVRAVVVTHNRRELLLGCLRALAAQTHPLAGVLVVDSASSDGTAEAVRDRAPDGLAVDYVRLRRNGGGAEGFSAGVELAREAPSDWLWLMDDDCAPEPGALAALLGAPRAADPAAVLLAPLVVDPGGAVQPLTRGRLQSRWLRSPVVALTPGEWRAAETPITFCSLVAPLVRTAAARAIAPPRRELFIWFDDLEYCLRLRGLGGLWLIPAARVVHHDARPLPDTGTRALLADWLRPEPFAQRWKRTYGMRNLVHIGLRHGFLRGRHAASFVAACVLRGLLVEDHRRRSAWLTLRYARDAWRGAFVNLPPERWAELAEHPRPAALLREARLRYDRPAAP